MNDLKAIKSVKDGGTLYAMETQHILDKEMDIIDKLLKTGKDVLFMPDSFFGKGIKFDVIVFKENSYYTADLKKVNSTNPDTIADAISYGATQGKNIVADINNNIDYRVLANGLNAAAIDNGKLNSVVLFYKGKTKTYYRNSIISNRFKSTIYNDFIKN